MLSSTEANPAKKRVHAFLRKGFNLPSFPPLVAPWVDPLVLLPEHDDDLPRDRVVRARSRALVVQVVGLEVLVDPAVPGPIPLTTENRH